MVKITIESDDGTIQFEVDHYYMALQETEESWIARNLRVSVEHRPAGWTVGQFSRFSPAFMAQLKEHVDELNERYEQIVVRPERLFDGPGLTNLDWGKDKA